MKLFNKKILENAKLENELAAGESNTAELYTVKSLTSTDDISFDNDVEITKIERTSSTGRNIDFETSTLITRGETVSVTSPTGEDRNYTPYILLVISSLGIVGAGIILIKKFIL